MKNQAAVALGRMAKGVPKTLTDEQRIFRANQLAEARKKRHGKTKRVARRSNKRTQGFGCTGVLAIWSSSQACCSGVGFIEKVSGVR